MYRGNINKGKGEVTTLVLAQVDLRANNITKDRGDIIQFHKSHSSKSAWQS